MHVLATIAITMEHVSKTEFVNVTETIKGRNVNKVKTMQFYVNITHSLMNFGNVKLDNFIRKKVSCTG